MPYDSIFLTTGSASEKENMSKSSTSSKVNIYTPTSAKKSIFKKIGTRKLKSGKIASPRRGKPFINLIGKVTF